MFAKTQGQTIQNFTAMAYPKSSKAFSLRNVRAIPWRFLGVLWLTFCSSHALYVYLLVFFPINLWNSNYTAKMCVLPAAPREYSTGS